MPGTCVGGRRGANVVAGGVRVCPTGPGHDLVEGVAGGGHGTSTAAAEGVEGEVLVPEWGKGGEGGGDLGKGKVGGGGCRA